MIDAICYPLACLFFGWTFTQYGRGDEAMIGVVLLMSAAFFLGYSIYFGKIWVAWFKQDCEETRVNLIKYFRF